MAAIRQTYNKIIANLPKSHIVNIEICKSQKHMLEKLLRQLRYKVTNKNIADLQYVYNKKINSQQYQKQQSKPLKRLLKCKKKRLPQTRLAGISSDPILINARVFTGSSETDVAKVILHELGHWYYRKKFGGVSPHEERFAEQFAYRWIKKLIKKGIISEP